MKRNWARHTTKSWTPERCGTCRRPIAMPARVGGDPMCGPCRSGVIAASIRRLTDATVALACSMREARDAMTRFAMIAGNA